MKDVVVLCYTTIQLLNQSYLTFMHCQQNLSMGIGKQTFKR